MPTGLCSVKNKVTSGVSKGMPKPYGAWQVWEDAPTFTAISFAETIDGGQAFRWQKIESFYEGRWDENVVRLRFKNEQIEFAIPLGTDSELIQQNLACLLYTSPSPRDA